VPLRISVIVPAKDAEEILPATLRALDQQTLTRGEYEVIVVDDGSSDGTAGVAEKHQVRCLRQCNRGPAAARNAGAAVAEGALLVFTDADCEAAPDFLERLTGVFEVPEIAGAMGAYHSRQRERVARFVQQEFEHKQARMARRTCINTVHTYAAAYRRSVFLENGGFDSHYTIPSNEDQEFSYRLAAHGYHMVFVPSAGIYHQHDKAVAEYVKRKYLLGFWKAYTLLKHPKHLTGDTHTPRAQLLEIGLVVPMLGLALLSLFWHDAAPVTGLMVLAFLLAGVAFSLQVLRRDRAILWMVPGMLFLRAASQATGLLVGFVVFGLGWARDLLEPGGGRPG